MHDFDFLFGHWTIMNRRLKERLKDCSEWEQFEAKYECEPVLNGLGNVDRFSTKWHGKEFEGLSLRIFNRETKNWSIYWVDNHTPVLQKPLVGRFDGPTGEFYCEDQFENRPILARFIWTKIDANEARWEQAFSLDEGRTWESNWVMEFAREHRSRKT
jgi:hypothetical protein